MSAETNEEELQKIGKHFQKILCDKTKMFALGSVGIEALFVDILRIVTVQKSESVVFVDDPMLERRRNQFDHPSPLEWCRGEMYVTWKGRNSR